MRERTDWHKLSTPELFEYRDQVAWMMAEVASHPVSGETMALGWRAQVRWIDEELGKRQALNHAHTSVTLR